MITLVWAQLTLTSNSYKFSGGGESGLGCNLFCNFLHDFL